jgi:hypothetical protein
MQGTAVLYNTLCEKANPYDVLRSVVEIYYLVADAEASGISTSMWVHGRNPGWVIYLKQVPVASRRTDRSSCAYTCTITELGRGDVLRRTDLPITGVLDS